MKEKGLIQIYTGEGKGKTTASVGLAVRANARGLKVCYISFHKDPFHYKNGEQKTLKSLGVAMRHFAKSHPFCPGRKKIKKPDLAADAKKGLNFIKKTFKDNKYDLLIADELNICVRDGFLAEEDVLDVLNQKPENMEFVLTGRGATSKMIKKADLVSFIKETKHPYKKGIASRKGIEF